MDPGALSLLAAGADWAAKAESLISTSPWLAPLAIFVGGILTAANPCVLATIPLLMAYVSGRDDVRSFRRGMVLSLAFVAGLSLAFAALGVIAALAGTMLGDMGRFWDYAILVVCLLMGAHLTGLLEVPMPSISVTPKWRGLPGAFLLGGLFGAVSTPCATPILVVVLTYIAGTGASVPYGALLLVVYALGHSLLILAAGASASLAKGLVASKGLARAGRVLRFAAGLLIAGVGVYLFMGSM